MVKPLREFTGVSWMNLGQRQVATISQAKLPHFTYEAAGIV